MKPSFGTKLKSYFVDVELEETLSVYSGKLEVICRNGRYALCTKNAVYSYDDLYVNFRDSFQQLDLDQYGIKNVLVLGLGLGSIPLLLEKKFKKTYHYTLIEIDQKIVDLARKYTLDELQSSFSVVCIDALEYVRDCPQQFDLVAIDIFIDDQIPSVFESIEFLENVKKILSPNALLMYNQLTYNEALLSKTEFFFQTKFKSVFPEAVFLSLSGNKMLLNRACPTR
jgi:predicted membrane-bound spermidine synthase